MAGTLDDVIRRREQRRAAEGEDHGIRVQRAQTSEREERQVHVELWPDHLGGDEESDSHADDTPHDHHDGELTNDRVVVLSLFVQRTTPVVN